MGKSIPISNWHIGSFVRLNNPREEEAERLAFMFRERGHHTIQRGYAPGVQCEEQSPSFVGDGQH